MPLKSMTVYSQDDQLIEDITTLKAYIKEELNVIDMTNCKDTEKIGLSGVLNFKVVGKRLGSDMKPMMEAVKSISQEDLVKFQAEGTITLLGHELKSEELYIVRKLQGIDKPNLHFNGD